MNEDCKEKENSILLKTSEYFNRGYNCCESVILASGDYLGIDSGVIPRIATPFGGGISGRRYMCGALSAAIMAIGLRYGRDDTTQERETSTAKADSLVNRFLETYGSVNCMDIIGYDPNDPGRIQRDKARIRSTICTPLVKQVALWLQQELE